jgi:hypothetical protein
VEFFEDHLSLCIQRLLDVLKLCGERSRQRPHGMSKCSSRFGSITQGLCTLAKIPISVEEWNKWVDSVEVKMVAAEYVSTWEYEADVENYRSAQMRSD